MWLTNTSIRRPVFITVVVLALIILGLTARRQMRAELNPNIDLPFITIVTVYPGAGPQEMELQVTKPIEDAVGSTAGLKNMTSNSQDGVSSIFMEFQLGTDSNVAAADVRDKLSAARGSLPVDVDEPVITKADISAAPILTMALDGPMSGRDLRILADKTIKDRLAKVSGVASVYVSGGETREVAVAVDRDRLQAYGLSINEVAYALQAENINLPAGQIREGTGGALMRDYAVRMVGEFKNADEIANIEIKLPDDNGPAGTVRLGDIASVRDTVVEPTDITRLNGKSSVVLAVQKQSDANTVDVADGVKKELAQLNGYSDPRTGQPVKGLLPNDTKLLVTTDDSEFVKESLNDVNRSLLEGVALVVLIVFLFLHSTRATLIVALAIPTSLIATFLPINSLGFTMNMMTMLALTLCVGILVDDSIVVLENIERHVRKGEAPREAALNGRAEIGLAAVTITLVDVVVFVPIAFMGGIVGRFFQQFGVTVATATLFSLFVSFNLTPMLASRWLKSRAQEEAEADRLSRSFIGRLFARIEAFYATIDRGYRNLLVWALQNRALTIVIGVVSLLVILAMLPVPRGMKVVIALLAVVLPLLTTLWNPKSRGIALGFAALMAALALWVQFPLGGEFIPATDKGKFSVSIELPAGSGLDATDKVVRQIEGLLAKTPGMEFYQSTVGSSSSGHFGAGSSGAQYAKVSVKMFDRGEQRPASLDDVMAQVNDQTSLIPGAKIRIMNDEQAGMGGQPIQMEITGANVDEIVKVSEQVTAAIEKVPGVTNVKSSWEVGKPELRVSLDRLRAADLGVNVAQVASALRTSIEGDTNAKLRDQGEEYDIRIRLAKVDRQNVTDVGNIVVGKQEGLPVYLRDVAGISLAAAPNQISRKNRQRLVAVGANLAYGNSLANVQQSINKALAQIPTGSTNIRVGGTSDIMNESFGYMVSALFLAIVLVYLLMSALFESFITPMVIMFALPQAMIGALLALMLTGKTLSIITMIGIIMLIGLVTKNAILLVDYTNTLRSRGKKREEAILEAGPTRLRPIMMTTLAMVGGMLPTALAMSKGSEMRAPMAIAVMGGLLLSAMLTLLVIPTAYTIVDDWWIGLRRRLGLRSAPPELEEFGEIKPPTGAETLVAENTPSPYTVN